MARNVHRSLRRQADALHVYLVLLKELPKCPSILLGSNRRLADIALRVEQQSL